MKKRGGIAGALAVRNDLKEVQKEIDNEVDLKYRITRKIFTCSLWSSKTTWYTSIC